MQENSMILNNLKRVTKNLEILEMVRTYATSDSRLQKKSQIWREILAFLEHDPQIIRGSARSGVWRYLRISLWWVVMGDG